ncbi:MAG: MMPL family transporter, partial [Pirellulales bacterium]
MGCRPRRVAPCEPRSHRGISWRLWAAIASCVCTVVACFGISKLHFNDDVRALLRSVDAGAAAADFERIDEITARFGAADSSCIIRAKAQVGDLFSPDSMLSLQTLTDRLATVHGVLEVRSIFDIRREGIAGAVLPVIPRTADPLSEEKLAEVRSRAVRHPLIGGHLLNEDASSSLIMLQLAHSFDAPPAVSSVITNIEDILNHFRSTQPQLNFQLTGLPVLRQQAAQALRRDMLLFNSLGLSLAVVLSATIARSLRSTVVACVPPFIGAVWAMGILGLTGMPINILTCVVPSLALV